MYTRYGCPPEADVLAIDGDGEIRVCGCVAVAVAVAVAVYLCICVSVYLCICVCVPVSCVLSKHVLHLALLTLCHARVDAGPVLPALAPTIVTAASACGAGSSSEGPFSSRCLMRWWQASTDGTAGLGAGGPSARW